MIIVISHFRVTRSSPKTRFDHERRYRARALSNINSKKINLLFLWISFILVWIPRNFKTFIFKPKWSFLRGDHKNDNLGELSDFYEFTLFVFWKFSQKWPLLEWPFSEMSRKSYIGWIRWRPGINPSYHFCAFLTNDNLRVLGRINYFSHWNK